MSDAKSKVEILLSVKGSRGGEERVLVTVEREATHAATNAAAIKAARAMGYENVEAFLDA